MVSQLSSLSGSLILAMGYGYEVKGLNDRKVQAAGKLVQVLSETVLPGALLVNDLPFCESSVLVLTTSALSHTSTTHP
jgi:hypothetical protein